MSESQNETLPSAAYLVLSNDDYAKCEGFTIGRRPLSVVCHPEGHVVAYFVSSAHKREAQEYAHSRSLASHSDAVRELVRAAKLADANYARNQHSDETCGSIFMGDEEHEAWTALRSALANPALAP